MAAQKQLAVSNQEVTETLVTLTLQIENKYKNYLLMHFTATYAFYANETVPTTVLSFYPNQLVFHPPISEIHSGAL